VPTSFELSLPFFVCLCETHVLTYVTIISLHLHKLSNAHLPGIILTLVMCYAMNRSMSKVLVGGFGSGGGSATKKQRTDAVGTVKQVLADDVVEMLTQSKKIIIVPGYGMVSVLDDESFYI